MTFVIELVLPQTPRTTTVMVPSYDPELDDVRSVLGDVCEALEDAGARFCVQICSKERWPVTVRTDLSLVLEQLAGVLAALAAGLPTKLELYEQGVERVVSLVPGGSTVAVECDDMIRKPSSVTTSAVLDRRMVIERLCRLASDFLAAADACCAPLARHPWFVAFRLEVSRSVDLARASRW